MVRVFLTFLVTGLAKTSLNPSSAFILCKFSYKIAIFLSLSQPVGLKVKKKELLQKGVQRRMALVVNFFFFLNFLFFCLLLLYLT